MEMKFLYFLLSLLLLLVASRFYHLILSSRKKLPPGPPGFPILGHLHLLKPPMHRALHRLSQKYGPIISLRFGSRLAVVVSSSSLVEECFTKNDVVLANRPHLLMGKHLGYNNTTIDHSDYGDHWRNLRRIASMEIFSTHRLNVFLSFRREETRRLLVNLSHYSLQGFAKVELKSLFQELSFNAIMRMVAGKRYYGDDVSDEEEAKQFREIIKEAFSYFGASNLGDFLPIWSWIDGGDFKKRVVSLAKRTDKFLQRLVDQRRSSNKLDDKSTMIDHLLSLQESQPNYYTDEIIKGFILVMLLGGTETSAVTLEWALSNLLNHPNTLSKARDELDEQVGQDQLLNEPDLSKLPYLHNIISETLRLFPALPLLLPHQASESCTIGGYHVPRDTILLVNAWATHRDPTLWDDATSFKPERFENGKELEPYKLLAFGMGRRSCPGAGLAQRMVGLTLGSLIQCFEWEIVSGQEIDMTEGKGLSMPKVKPLEAMCKARPIMSNVMSKNFLLK